MIKNIIENINKAEKEAKNIEKKTGNQIIKLETANQIKIEKLKETAVANLKKQTSKMIDAFENENADFTEEASKKSTNKKQSANKRVQQAKQLIISHFFKRVEE